MVLCGTRYELGMKAEQHVYSSIRFDSIDYFTLFFLLCSNVPKYIKSKKETEKQRKEEVKNLLGEIESNSEHWYKWPFSN